MARWMFTPSPVFSGYQAGSLVFDQLCLVFCASVYVPREHTLFVLEREGSPGKGEGCVEQGPLNVQENSRRHLVLGWEGSGAGEAEGPSSALMSPRAPGSPVGLGGQAKGLPGSVAAARKPQGPWVDRPRGRAGHSQDERLEVLSLGNSLLIQACQGGFHPDHDPWGGAGTSRVQRKSLEPSKRDTVKGEAWAGEKSVRSSGLTESGSFLLASLCLVHRCDAQM